MLFCVTLHCRLIELHSDATGEEESESPTDDAVMEDSDADISSDSDTDVLDDHEKNLTALMRKDKSASVWQCTVCEYSSKRKFRVCEHAKSKHMLLQGYDCPLCGQTCPSSNALRMHKKRKHKE